MRNGRDIGRAKAVFGIPDKKVGSHVYLAREGAPEGLLFGHHWHGVAMPGHMADDGAAPDQMAIDDAAQAAALAVVHDQPQDDPQHHGV